MIVNIDLSSSQRFSRFVFLVLCYIGGSIYLFLSTSEQTLGHGKEIFHLHLLVLISILGLVCFSIFQGFKLINSSSSSYLSLNYCEHSKLIFILSKGESCEVRHELLNFWLTPFGVWIQYKQSNNKSICFIWKHHLLEPEYRAVCRILCWR